MATYTSEIEREDAVQMPEIDGPANAATESPKPRRHLLLIGGLAVVAAVAVGFYLHSRNRISTDDAQVDGHIVPIAAKISGSVEQVLVDDNQQVKAGDVLVRIDPRDYQARLDQARAALAIAESSGAGSASGSSVDVGRHVIWHVVGRSASGHRPSGVEPRPRGRPAGRKCGLGLRTGEREIRSGER